MNRDTQNEILKMVARNYDEIADHYSETRKKQLWEELLFLSKDVVDGDKILDVGCGSGKLLYAFDSKKVDYLGIDPCFGLLENARKNFPDYYFKEGNILKLRDLKEYDFDYIFCIAVLQHIPGFDFRVDAMRQLKNKLKPQGKIIVSVWNMWKSKKYRRLIFKFWFLRVIGKNKMDFGDVVFDWKSNQGLGVSRRYYHAFSKGELKRICRQAGLKIYKIYKKDYNYYLILGK